MIYHLLYPLSERFFIFNLTRYITFRGGLALVTSFLLVFCFWPYFLKILKKLQLFENIDMYGNFGLENLHQKKKGTPTMGGVIVVASILISVLIWARLDNLFIWSLLLVMVSLSVLGLVDDYRKIKKGKGLSRGKKLFWQSLIGLVFGILIFCNKDVTPGLSLPFLKDLTLNLGYFYIFWALLMVVATSNAVNFTDGLDGLAVGSLAINGAIFALFAYLAGHINFAQYLIIPYVAGSGELTVLSLALVGSSLAFLWYNCHPAEIFMGDTGALALGGVIGAMALIIKKEFVLFLSGGLFVIEALSVVAQMLSLKIRGKKVLKAAPLHHHFQLKLWPESKIIVRFWIITIICSSLALLTLKLR